MDDRDAYLRLALVQGLTPTVALRLLALGETPGAVFSWSIDRLLGVPGMAGDQARRICDPRGADLVAHERATCHAAGVQIVTPVEAGYPGDLLRLADPPLALWMQGELQERDRLAIAVVGPRRPTAYAHRQAHRFAAGLSQMGTCIVSGLGRGVDTIAHQAALEAGGRTVAVLGSGFAQLYPPENRPLAERIVAGHGAVLSEFPMGLPPSASTFPRRSRIMAALSLATLVVEAANRSGALVSARLGLELGREVMVIPGPIDTPQCTGSNQLIRDGATLVASIDDVLDEVEPLLTLARGMRAEAAPGDGAAAGAADGPVPLSRLSIGPPRAQALSGREKHVYLLLDDQPRDIETLARIGKVPPSAVAATLLSLELRRLVRKSPDGGYVRAL
jgi:DNA processing protein